MKNPFRKKTIRKGELVNVDVDLVSLVFDDYRPVNGKGAVIKAANGTSYRPVLHSTKIKAEPSLGRVYVTLMEPGVTDAQGDFYSPEEIVKAADHFAEKGLVGRNDVNHSMSPVPEFVVVETGILKAEDKEHYPDTKVGSWVQTLKCKDLSSPLWEKVKAGKLHGVSIYGQAHDLSDSAQENAALVQELKAQVNEIKKALGDKPSEDSQKAITTLENRIKELEKADSDSSINELLKAFTLEMKELTTTMKKAISKSLKDEPGAAVDEKVTVQGMELVVKASHREIYKGIANVDAGAAMNILNPNTTSLFIDEVVGGKEDDTLTDITVVEIGKDNTIDAGIIADLVFTNSLDEAAAAQAVATADITVTPGILTAEFTLGRDTVEFYKEKYGEQAFGAYVEQHIAKKTAKAIRKLLFRGDRAAAAGVYKALDGVVKIATTGSDVTSLDDDTYVTWVEKFEAALKSFSDDMLEEQANFVIYVSHKDLISIRSELAKRETQKGDMLLLEGGNVSFGGIPVKGRLLADNYIVMGLPKFIIIGYRTDAELKVEHHGADWKYHWYIRVRPGITYLDGFVKVFLVS